MTEGLDSVLIRSQASIRDALQAIDAAGYEIALVVDDDRRLIGVATDGDVRHALLAGASLEDPVEPYVTRAPYTALPEEGRGAVLDLMQVRHIKQVPIVDSAGTLLGLHVLHELLGGIPRPNLAVIMAGGRGRRLGALTDEMPKPMLPVAGRPILERLVHHLVGNGITRIAIAVNYQAHVIEEHFGDGGHLGCRITYLREDSTRPLGTGGALGLLVGLDESIDDPVLVMNGDLVTDFDVEGILRHHELHGAMATVAVHEYSHEVPYGVVQFDETGLAAGLEEKPVVSWPVNAGIYVFDPKLLERIPVDVEFAITSLLEESIARGEPVVAWPLTGQWQDVGHPEELRRARGES